ncbi:MAG: hypothetical protein AB1422_01445 [bacterium]
MKRRSYILLIILVVGLYHCEVRADNKGPGDTYTFLKLAGGAKAMSMGNAYVAMADDASATYWNPAGLALLENREIIFMDRSSAIKEVGEQHQYIGVVLPYKGYDFGFSYINLGVDEIEKTSINNYDEPIILGKFKDKETAYIFSIGGLEPIKELYLGANYKYISHRLAGYEGKGMGLDVGSLINLSEAWDWEGIFEDVKLGVVFRYMTDKKWDSGHKDSGYLETEMGLAWIPISTEDIKKWTIAMSGKRQLKNKTVKLSVGTELQYKILALRCGVDNWYLGSRYGLDRKKLNYARKVTLGIGLKIKKFNFDYALTPKWFGNDTQISVGWKF